MKVRKKDVPLPKAVADRFNAMKSAVAAATAPYVKSPIGLSVFYLHDIVGAEEFLDRTLSQSKERHISAVFKMAAVGPVVELSWVES
jgi:hypothetical protein